MPPDTEQLDFRVLFGNYFLGHYLGVLTLVPLALAIREITYDWGWRAWWRRQATWNLVRDGLLLTLPTLLLLIWLATIAPTDLRLAICMATLLPIAWLSLRHGWYGSAIGGSLTAIAIAVIVSIAPNATEMQAQAFRSFAMTILAFALTSFLMLGSRIALLHQRETQTRTNERLSTQWALQSIQRREQQLQQISFAVRDLSNQVGRIFHDLLSELRLHVISLNDHKHRRRHAITQHNAHRLANSVYPLSLDSGLFIGLKHGNLARVLSQSNIDFICVVSGGRIAALSDAGKTMMYRLICEAVMHLLAKQPCQQIRLSIRGGVRQGRAWIALRLDSLNLPQTAPDFSMRELNHHAELSRIGVQLGTLGLTLCEMQQHAKIQQGLLRINEGEGHTRLALLMHDTPSPF